MRTRSTAILLAGSIVLLCSTQAIAKKHTKKAKRIAGATVTGLAAMHTIRRVGNKLCMSDHYHFGDGSSSKSKARAMAVAKRDWVSFVRAEYGPGWAHYSLSGSKGGKCSRTNGLYKCSISSRPCRR